MPYILLFALIFYVLYRIFLFWWDLHKKKNELKHEMDEYINGLIDECFKQSNCRFEQASPSDKVNSNRNKVGNINIKC